MNYNTAQDDEGNIDLARAITSTEQVSRFPASSGPPVERGVAEMILSQL